MLSIKSRGKVPGVFPIVGIAHNNFSRPIDPALLEVIALYNVVIIVAGPTGLFGAIWDIALQGERTSIETSQNDLFM
ncbi:MAG: hypothetical protein QME90_06950 [Thermodesulfobacteriota bacterium]|nr:hypothetical protein [Thermodesulfobacteriota bacterium]